MTTFPLIFIEVRRDFTGYYDDKMRRVQRKVDNLRKAASSSYLFQLSSYFINNLLKIIKNLMKKKQHLLNE